MKRLLAAGGLLGALAAVLVVLAVTGPSDRTSPPGEGSADIGFARDMSVHHQQAVEMSFIVRDRTDDEEVRRLAYDIINTQANQRGMMLGWLDAWDVPKHSADPPMSWMASGHEHHAPRDGALMPGMATDTELDELRAAEGEQAEIRYLRLMTAHHRSGVTMAQAAVDQASTEEITALATAMARGQNAEIDLMADMLTARGATP